jgi:hypothetical protein
MKRTRDTTDDSEQQEDVKRARYSKYMFLRDEDIQWFQSQPIDTSINNQRLELLEESYYYAELMSNTDNVSCAIYSTIQENIEEMEQVKQLAQGRQDFTQEEIEAIYDSNSDAFTYREIVPRKIETHVVELKRMAETIERIDSNYRKYLDGEASIVDNEEEADYIKRQGDDGCSYLLDDYLVSQLYENQEQRKYILDEEICNEYDDEQDRPFDILTGYMDENGTSSFALGYTFEEKTISKVFELDDEDEISKAATVTSEHEIDWNNFSGNSAPYLQLVEYLITHKPLSQQKQSTEETDDDIQYSFVPDEQYAKYLKLLEIILINYRQLEQRSNSDDFRSWSRVICRHIIDSFAIYEKESEKESVPEEEPAVLFSKRFILSYRSPDGLAQLDLADEEIIDDFSISDAEDESDDENDDQIQSLEVTYDLNPFWNTDRLQNKRVIPLEVSRTVADNYLYTIASDNEEEDPVMLHCSEYESDGLESDEEDDLDDDDEEQNNDKKALTHLLEEQKSIHRDIVGLSKRGGLKFLNGPATAEALFVLREYMDDIIAAAVEDAGELNTITGENIANALKFVDGKSLYSRKADVYLDCFLEEPDPEDVIVMSDGFQMSHSTIDEDLEACTISGAHEHHNRVKLLNDSYESDITLKLIDPDGTVHSRKVHKQILKMRSPFFESMWNETSGLMEAQQDEVDMSETFQKSSLLDIVLQYIYTDQIPENLDSQTLVDIISLASLLVLDRLTTLCEYVLWRKLDADNLLDMISICRLFNLSQLFAKIERMIVFEQRHLLNSEDTTLTESEKKLFSLHEVPITVLNVVEKLRTILELLQSEYSDEQASHSLCNRLKWWKIQYSWFIVRNFDTMENKIEYGWFKLDHIKDNNSEDRTMKDVVLELYDEVNVYVLNADF